MNRSPSWHLAAFAFALLAPGLAHATGFTDRGQDIVPSTETRFELDGYLRLRSEALYNLDLDRGPTPSGQLLFPVSVSDPKQQTLTYHDLRLRTDFAAYAPGGVVAVKARVDMLDNMPLGGSADGIPGGSTTQRPPEDTAFRIKRAWGEVLTPVGYIAAGRMGHHWGLGMLGNSGDCADCDSGDAADRITFITAAASHIFAVAYDFSAAGYNVPRKNETRSVDIEPSAQVRTFTFAILNWRDDAARKRRAKAGKATFEYGGSYARRWQSNDIPATYLQVAADNEIDAAQVVARGLNANVFDVWSRLSFPGFRVEVEGAYMTSTFEQASLVPGLLMQQRVESRQYGAVLESEGGDPDGPFGAGLDLGYASGDDAPGFGARNDLGSLEAPQAGDLDGPQGVPPYDFRVDNFRFHPDYHVDRILFREIIGTVTDATYIRPHVRVRLLDFGTGRLQASLAGIASWANYASSTPGGEKYLGFEIDPTLVYTSDDGFSAAFEHALLLPGAGLNNPDLGLTAKPAQIYRLRLSFGF